MHIDDSDSFWRSFWGSYCCIGNYRSKGSATADARVIAIQRRYEMVCRLVVVAAGAAAGKFLHYEEAAPAVAAQTAYGIEAEVEGYEQSYDAESMLFMDFRRHHTGVWPNAAQRCLQHTAS